MNLEQQISNPPIFQLKAAHWEVQTRLHSCLWRLPVWAPD